MKISVRIQGLRDQLGRAAASRIADAAKRAAADKAQSRRNQQGVGNDFVRQQGVAGVHLRDAED